MRPPSLKCWQTILHFMVFFSQVRVLAEDGGDPPKSATVTVLVRVERNLYSPRFNPQKMEYEILETQALGVPVAIVNATDQDTKVRKRLLDG